MQALLDNLGIMIPAILGVILLTVDVFLRHRDRKADLAFRQKQYEQERDEMRKRAEWLQQQQVRLMEVGKPLAREVSAQLLRDTTWAAEALEKAKIGPYSETLFGERLGHFREEKEFIAERFLPELLKRCRWLVEKGDRTVYLVMDSGTTLYPFFSKLGVEAVRSCGNAEGWIGKCWVVSNNLPGIEALIENGRVSRTDRYSGLALHCKLLPGDPLPVYSAVTGKDTEEGLRRIHEAHKSSHFIGLTTGNWVRLRNSSPRCPVPLARGEGHLHFKKELVGMCDEVYVVAPLGKVFTGVTAKQVNTALGLQGAQASPDRQPYGEVVIDDARAAGVVLVSTSRAAGRVLSALGEKVQGALNVKPPVEGQSWTSFAKPIGHYMPVFDNLPHDWYLQKEVEFPHPQTRTREFMEEYHCVPTAGPA